MEFEFINESDMEFVPRGRKTTVPPQLVEALKKLTAGKACKITGMKVNPKATTFKTDKARVGAVIRQGAKQAKVVVTISWAQDGTPQVVKRK